MKIGILTPSLIYGDAVSNDVAGMYYALSEAGYEVYVYANDWLVTHIPVRHVSTIRDALRDADDLFIYHFSVGWQEGFDLVRTLPCRTLIKYHNVTPPEFFDGVNSDYADVCRSGREMLEHVATAPVNLFLSDSEYNMGELVAGGAAPGRSVVIPPFHQIDKLLEADADLPTLDRLRDGKMNCLMVGRLAPNKGHVSLVDAFSVYYHDFNRKSRLVIVGKQDPRLDAYLAAIHERVARENLTDAVLFIDGVTDESLKAYFLTANAFTITSEHEGFCVPLVEAMAHHVPVVAYASTAITETAGDGAIVWPERSPELFAASLDEVYRNPAVAEGLGHMGWQRYQRTFRNAVTQERFLHLIGQVANGADERL